MSRSYREDCILAKQAKVGIIEQRPKAGRAKKPKPFIVEYRTWTRGEQKPVKWRTWGRYHDEEAAKEAAANQNKKLTTSYWAYEFRVKDKLKTEEIELKE